jgi:hypothetical protein
MRCASCGNETPIEDERFCEACGKPLNNSADSPAPGPPLASKLSPSTPETDRSDPVARARDIQPVKRGAARRQQLGWAVLAVLLYLTVADAAVETFLRDSPLRWWIAGAALLYLALCAAVWRLTPKLWRRWNWASQSALSIVVLLALMSATAWMPGGLDRGMNLFGQSTSIVLAIVSAASVAISGIFLARLRFVPLAGKIVAGLLAAYGVAAFLLAVQDGSSYSALFHGSSLWARLPSWLQGATIGGLFVVPVALLLEIVTGLRKITRDKISDFAFKVVALGMSVVISVASVRTPAAYDSAGIETPPWLSGAHDKLPQGEAGYERASETLNRIYAGLDLINNKMDRSLFEIDALAARLGSDPATIFHFVRDEIRFEPYTGVLRGALGTLLCRAGNSLDRSLLLAALLQKAGLTTQIVSGQLTTQQAQLLESRMFEPVKSVPTSAPSFAELAPALAGAIGVDQSALLGFADHQEKNGAKRKREFLNSVENQTGSLSTLIDKSGVDAGVLASKDQLLEEAGEHYWVRYEDSSGQWVDLDTAFADAEPGKTITSATGSFPPDVLPEQLYHRLQVTLTLRVTQVVDGKDRSANDLVLLDQELRVADQPGKDILIANAPVPMPSSTNAGMSLTQALEPTKGYQAVLQVGSQVTSGKYFDLSGQISDARGGSAEGAAAANAGGIGRSLGGLTGNMNSALSSGSVTTTRIVGEWADYKLISPRPHNGAPITYSYHRDIIAPTQITAWSASSADSPEQIPTKLDENRLRQRLFWRAELLPVIGAMPVDYSGYLAIKSLSDNRAWVDALARTALGLSQAGRLKDPSNPVPIHSLLLADGAMRLANDVSRLSPPAGRRYFWKPGLLAYESGVAGTSDHSHIRRGYDIVAFAPRIAVNDAGTSSQIRHDASAMNLQGGVIATELEWALMDPAKRSSSGSPNGEISLSGARVLEAAADAGVPLVLLRGPTDLRTLATISAPASVKAELWATLATGDIVVVPAKPVVLDGQEQVAWWRVEPTSGEVIGVMPGGRGQAMTEYTVEDAWGAASYAMCFYDAKRGSGAQGAVIFVSCLASAYAFHEAGEGWPASNFGANNPEWMQFFDILSVGLFHCGEAWFSGESCL